LVCGFSIHAGVSIREDVREGLERLLRYAGVGQQRRNDWEQLPDGRLIYRLKTPRKYGTTHVMFEPLELAAHAVLVPAPRVNLVKINGVLESAAKWRAAIIPGLLESDACNCRELPDWNRP
jgi:hypothetical protein